MKGDPTFIPWWGKVILSIWVAGILWYVGVSLLFWAALIAGFATIAWLLLLAVDTLGDWLDKK